MEKFRVEIVISWAVEGIAQMSNFAVMLCSVQLSVVH